MLFQKEFTTTHLSWLFEVLLLSIPTIQYTLSFRLFESHLELEWTLPKGCLGRCDEGSKDPV